MIELQCLPRAEDLELASERRRFERHILTLRGLCRPVGLSEGDIWPVKTCDVSAGGVALKLARRFEPGTLLSVGFQTIAGVNVFSHVARVVRVRVAGTFWNIGCVWASPLEEGELSDLLDPTWQSLPLKKVIPPPTQPLAAVPQDTALAVGVA